MTWVLLLIVVCMVVVVGAGLYTVTTGRKTAASRQDHGIEG